MSSIYDVLNRLDSDTNRVNFEYGRQHLGENKLDKQAFMQLLMAKMKNQNPLDPVKDNEFLSQQAQLAQVEKLEDLVKVIQGNSLLSQAGTLMGKTVDIRKPDGTTVTGKISVAEFSNGTAGIVVNGQSYSMNQITKIYAD